MKRLIIITTIGLAVLQISGCSSTQTGMGINSGSSATTAISEQRVASSEFKRQGVKVYYTLIGNLEAIEATGYAPVWGNSENALRESFRVAELEAKKSLNDFINKETITSTTSVKMISQNLEHARDQKTNKFSSNRVGNLEDLVSIDEELDREKNSQASREDNIALRKDALRISSIVNTTITNTNRGILGGMHMIDGQAINDGKNVRVIMRWDRKHDDIRLQVRNLMMR